MDMHVLRKGALISVVILFAGCGTLQPPLPPPVEEPIEITVEEPPVVSVEPVPEPEPEVPTPPPLPPISIVLTSSQPVYADVARELALYLLKFPFWPEAVHTPGVAHVVVDRLSRIFAPGDSMIVDSSVHPALQEAVLETGPRA